MHIAAAAGRRPSACSALGRAPLRALGEKAVAVRGPRSFDQFLAVDPDLSQAIRHMSDLPVRHAWSAAAKVAC
jgi:hypothetical protein